MQSDRTAWTDERLEDLSARITRMDSRITGRFDSIDATLHGIQRSMIVVLATVLTVFGGVLAAAHL